ncbi:MAG: T9SS type A sorting domain-containing protein, partial [bacterium]|nr:T9SS type A sorting domain-containing protein [Candidatus Kapabacteria bacterium]
YFNISSLVAPNETVTIDYDMQPYVNLVPDKGATYIVHAQMLYASGPNFENNAAMEAIQRPTTEFRMRRMNPICDESSPIVVIRNVGRNPLTRANITYGIMPGRTFSWTGNLAFNETDTVVLPAVDLSANPSNFFAAVSEPNGVADEYPRDNAMVTQFALPKVSSGTLFLSLRTDDYANDPSTTNGIRYEVVDGNDNVVHSGGEFEDRTIYRDTIRLADGCYRFIIYDEFEFLRDGLIPIRGTAGNYTLRDSKNVTIINGASNGPDYFAGFGDREVTSFVVTSASGVEVIKDRSAIAGISIYPNPNRGKFIVDFMDADHTSALNVLITDINGREILSRVVDSLATELEVDLSDQTAGTYVVSVAGDGRSWLGKVVTTGK